MLTITHSLPFLVLVKFLTNIAPALIIVLAFVIAGKLWLRNIEPPKPKSGKHDLRW